jgi:hypothetical protein
MKAWMNYCVSDETYKETIHIYLDYCNGTVCTWSEFFSMFSFLHGLGPLEDAAIRVRIIEIVMRTQRSDAWRVAKVTESGGRRNIVIV